jgi:putative NADH-flavin reductase
MMKLAVFGASGKTGHHVVEQALSAGHEVVALARTPSKLQMNHAKLRVIQGDVTDAQVVAQAIAGTDAVISLLGPNNRQLQFVVSRGTENILAAMKQHNVRRLIVAAGAGVGDPKDKPKLIDRFFGVMLKLLSKNAVEDMTQTAQLVRNSDREWTLVRVPMLTDDPKQNKLRIGYLGKDVGIRLSRADMAAFMLKQVSDTHYLRQSPVISN